MSPAHFLFIGDFLGSLRAWRLGERKSGRVSRKDAKREELGVRLVFGSGNSVGLTSMPAVCQPRLDMAKGFRYPAAAFVLGGIDTVRQSESEGL